MGFFDPVHKKILAKAPSRFRDGAGLWGVLLETVISTRVPDNPDIFRALVVGMLALRSANDDPGSWSHEALTYITGVTNNAWKALPGPTRELANATFATIVTEIWPDLPV